MNKAISEALDRLERGAYRLEGCADTLAALIRNAPTEDSFALTSAAISFYCETLLDVKEDLLDVWTDIIKAANEAKKPSRTVKPFTCLDMVQGKDPNAPEFQKRGAWLDAKEGVADV